MQYSFVMRHSILAHVFLIFCLIFSRCSSHERYLKLSFPNLSDEFYNITWNHTTLDRQLSKSIESSQCWDFNQHITISSRNITLDLFVCIKQNKIILTGFDKLLNKSYLSQIVCRKEKFDYKPCDDELNDLSKYFQSSIELSISEMNNESGYDATSICSTNPECRSGSCCNTRTCRLLPAHHICRSSSDCCDIEEYCTGDSSVCPEDDYFIDGVACRSKDNYEGVCKRGSCLSLLGECRRFHPLMRSGISTCIKKKVISKQFCNSIICELPANLAANLSAIHSLLENSPKQKTCLVLPSNNTLCSIRNCLTESCLLEKACWKCKTNQDCTIKGRCMFIKCSTYGLLPFTVWLLPTLIFSTVSSILFLYFLWTIKNKHIISKNVYRFRNKAHQKNVQNHNDMDLIYSDQSICCFNENSLSNSPSSNDIPSNSIVERFNLKDKQINNKNSETIKVKEQLEIQLLNMLQKISQNTQYKKCIVRTFARTYGNTTEDDLNNDKGMTKKHFTQNTLPDTVGNIDQFKYYEIQAKEGKVKKGSDSLPNDNTLRIMRQNNFEDSLSYAVRNVIVANISSANSDFLESQTVNGDRLSNLPPHSNHRDEINVTENNSTNRRRLYNWEISCSKCSDCPRIDEMENQLLLRDNKVKDNYLRSLITLTGKLHKSHHKFSKMKEEPADLSTQKEGVSLADIKKALKKPAGNTKKGKYLKEWIYSFSECSDCPRLVDMAKMENSKLSSYDDKSKIVSNLLIKTIVLHLSHHQPNKLKELFPFLLSVLHVTPEVKIDDVKNSSKINPENSEMLYSSKCTISSIKKKYAYDEHFANDITELSGSFGDFINQKHKTDCGIQTSVTQQLNEIKVQPICPLHKIPLKSLSKKHQSKDTKEPPLLKTNSKLETMEDKHHDDDKVSPLLKQSYSTDSRKQPHLSTKDSRTPIIEDRHHHDDKASPLLKQSFSTDSRKQPHLSTKDSQTPIIEDGHHHDDKVSPLLKQSFSTDSRKQPHLSTKDSQTPIIEDKHHHDDKDPPLLKQSFSTDSRKQPHLSTKDSRTQTIENKHNSEIRSKLNGKRISKLNGLFHKLKFVQPKTKLDSLKLQQLQSNGRLDPSKEPLSVVNNDLKHNKANIPQVESYLQNFAGAAQKTNCNQNSGSNMKRVSPTEKEKRNLKVRFNNQTPKVFLLGSTEKDIQTPTLANEFHSDNLVMDDTRKTSPRDVSWDKDDNKYNQKSPRKVTNTDKMQFKGHEQACQNVKSFVKDKIRLNPLSQCQKNRAIFPEINSKYSKTSYASNSHLPLQDNVHINHQLSSVDSDQKGSPTLEQGTLLESALRQALRYTRTKIDNQNASN